MRVYRRKTAFLPGIRRFSRFSPKLMQKPSVFLPFSGSAGCFLSKNAVLRALSYASFREKRGIACFPLILGVWRVYRRKNRVFARNKAFFALFSKTNAKTLGFSSIFGFCGVFSILKRPFQRGLLCWFSRKARNYT